MVRLRLARIASKAHASSPSSSVRSTATVSRSSPRPILAVKPDSAWIGPLRLRAIITADRPAAIATLPAMTISETSRPWRASSLRLESSALKAAMAASMRPVVSVTVTTPSSWSPSRTGALTAMRPGERSIVGPSKSLARGRGSSAIDGRTAGSDPVNRARPAWSTTTTETTSGSALAAWMASRVPSTLSSAKGLTSASAVTRARPVAPFANWSCSVRSKVAELLARVAAIERSYCRISGNATAAMAAATSSMIAAK